MSGSYLNFFNNLRFFGLLRILKIKEPSVLVFCPKKINSESKNLRFYFLFFWKKFRIEGRVFFQNPGQFSWNNQPRTSQQFLWKVIWPVLILLENWGYVWEPWLYIRTQIFEFKNPQLRNGVFFFFKFFLWCSQTGHHPHEDLAKFGNRPDMKGSILSNPFIKIGLPTWTWCRNLATLLLFLWNLVN